LRAHDGDMFDDEAMTLSLRAALEHHVDGLKLLSEYQPNTRKTQRENWRYANYYEAVLDLGQEFLGEKRPKGVWKKPYRQCFRNSSRAVFDHGWAYVEGYAMSEHGLMVEHAWNLTPDGHVVDLTWRRPEKSLYYGIVIDQETVSRLLVYHQVFGIIPEDWRIGAPLLKEGLFIPSTGLPPKEESWRS